MGAVGAAGTTGVDRSVEGERPTMKAYVGGLGGGGGRRDDGEVATGTGRGEGLLVSGGGGGRLVRG